MKRHLALLGALLLLCGTGYQAQATPAPQVTANSATSIVTGRVVDEQGEPVIGASIVEVGTTRGTSTDVDGNFSLRASIHAKLQISFIGYKTVEMPASASMHIVMAEDKALLDELVIVGYDQKPASHVSIAYDTKNTDKHPLVIVDGQTIEPEKIKDIDPKTIDHIDILKDKSAIEKYGEKAKNGVVVVTLKKKK